MARLSQLVTTLSDTLGVPEPTVRLYARHTQESGFITKKGRGKSAAQMSATDAANLLIAILGTITAKDAGTAIELYRNCRLLGTPPPEWADYEIPAIQKLTKGHSFGEAIEALVASAIDGTLEAFLTVTNPTGDKAIDLDPICLNVTVDSGSQTGMILILDHDLRGNRADYSPLKRPRMPDWSAKSLRRFMPGDLRRSSFITGLTFLAVGELLRESSS